ncbi:MAG: type II toxin-antitoxin system CcdA family antitoxin [Aliishimia sp.]
MQVQKRRTNVSIDAQLLETARDMGLNVSAISEAALAETIKAKQVENWQTENAEALQQRREWIAQNGAPLAKWQLWSPTS